jgi:hypothetical protein
MRSARQVEFAATVSATSARLDLAKSGLRVSRL